MHYLNTGGKNIAKILNCCLSCRALPGCVLNEAGGPLENVIQVCGWTVMALMFAFLNFRNLDLICFLSVVGLFCKHL